MSSLDALINKVWQQDCFETLKAIPSGSIDCVITDPPYGTTSFDYDEKSKSLDMKAWFAEILRVAHDKTPILIFASGKFTYRMIDIGQKYFRYEMVWDKVKTATGMLDANIKPLRNHEYVLYFSKTFDRYSKKYPHKTCNTFNHGVLIDKNNIKRNPNRFMVYGEDSRCFYTKLNDAQYPRSILKFNKSMNHKLRIHPNEKPLALITYLVNLYSNPGNLVFDPFAGSANVAYACIENKRRFICCELDEKFYNLATKRLNDKLQYEV